MQSIASFVDQAYQWLCHQRRDFPPDADVWDLRFRWQSERECLVEELVSGSYRLGALSVVTKADGETIHLWGSRDALVLKALALMIGPRLRISKRCVHVKGHGGLKAAVREVQQRLPDYRFVLRTDVKAFYESIDQSIMLGQLAAEIDDEFAFKLLGHSIRRTVERGGLYREIRTGISRGCPLSPLLGALYLRALDERLSARDVYYVRYMDDILVLTKTRWQLRRAVRVLNRTFSALKVAQHPDKTFIGRIEKGFDFLGYCFGGATLRLARQTVERHAQRLLRLYERQAKSRATPNEVARALGGYVTRWISWCTAGLVGALQTKRFCGIDGPKPTPIRQVPAGLVTPARARIRDRIERIPSSPH